MANANISWLPEEISQTNLMILRRARIDPEQSIQLCIGMDDFSRFYFFRVPPEWSKFFIYR